jgi:Domain of unknown function (DUF4129)
VNPQATRPGRGSSVRAALIVALLLAFPLFVVIAYMATRNVLPELSGLRLSSLQNASLSSGRQSLANITAGSDGGRLFPGLNSESLTNYAFLTVPERYLVAGLLLLTAAIATIVVARGIFMRKNATVPFESDDLLMEKRRRAAEILDAAASKLRSGSSYRDTVIQCYLLISEFLEEKSGMDGKPLTPREFTRRVSDKLEIDMANFVQVTSLFEVARYSLDDITREQAEQAATCLSNLSSPLKESPVVQGDVR